MARGSTVKVNDKTRAALRIVRRVTDEGIQEFCELVVKLAKRDVHRITGNLSDNIDWEKLSELAYVIFTQTGYGAFEELGTAFREPHPFIQPAIIDALRQFARGQK